MADSTVTIVGNVTREPELRYTQTNQAVATIGVAVNRRYQGRNGEWQEDVSFFNVTAWGSLGENAAASLNKGNRIIVTGRLEQRSYETQNGEKRSAVEIVADEIGAGLRWAQVAITRNERSEGGFSGGGSGGGGGGGGGYRQAPSSPSGGAPAYASDEEPF